MVTDSTATTDSRPALQIEAHLASGPAAITIEVVMRNHGAAPVAVFNRPHDFASYGVPESVGSFVSQVVLRDDGALSVAMIVPPLPGLRMVDVRSVPCVTELQPGAQQTDVVVIPTPVAEFNPYFPSSPGIPTEQVKSTRVEIWVDYLIVAPPITLERTEHPGCLQARGWTRDTVKRIIHRLSGVSVPVLKRRDAFHAVPRP
ncbi:MAG: hypothetical protein U1F54_17030 [Burkholderiales bacterium]